MRKVASLIICLLSGSFPADTAYSQNDRPAKPLPPDYRAQVVRVMSERNDLRKIYDAGITAPFTYWTLVYGTRWMVCVATLQQFYAHRGYQVTEISFNGKAEFMLDNLAIGRGSPSRTKLGGGCKGNTTSPFPEIVRGKPGS
jgi:hypothetical protein